MAIYFVIFFAFLHFTGTFVFTDQPEKSSAAEDSESRCELSLQKIPGMSPLIRTDRNGRSCRGDIKLPFCKGFCSSKESGTHLFPHREQEGAYFCGIITDNASMKNVTLEDCDEGAEDEVRQVQISTASECKCIKMS